MRELHYIEGSGWKLPIRCSNYVLEKIQKEYTDLKTFEDLLFSRKKNENGEYEKTDLKIEVLNNFLYMCVYEGLQLEALLENKPCEQLTPRQVIVLVDMSPFKLQVELIKEFSRAFDIKNVKTKRKKRPMKAMKTKLLKLISLG